VFAVVVGPPVVVAHWVQVEIVVAVSSQH